ncbi:putative tail protein [Xanthomonas virus PB119]|nr:putative tail protein [Xanthomonas virus PB119]
MIPQRSSQDLRGTWVEQQNRRNLPLIDYERGGTVLNSSSDDLQAVLWTAECVDDTVYVYVGDGPRTAVLTEAGITQIALAFDQTMRPHIAYVVGGVCKFHWFDSQINAMTTTVIPDATTPRLCMDEKRAYYTNSSDVILSYKKGLDLVVRVQRERFTVEHVIDTGIPGDLVSVGMNSKNRLQWFCVGDRE